MERLNIRQKALYAWFLQSEDRYYNPDDIIIALESYYDSYLINEGHQTAVYAMLRYDIRMLNQSGVERMIIGSRKGYKLGGHEETVKYIRKQIMLTIRKLIRLRFMLKKAGDNHQMRMNFNGTIKEVRPFGTEKDV